MRIYEKIGGFSLPVTYFIIFVQPLSNAVFILRICLVAAVSMSAQTAAVKERGKWGIKEDKKEVIPAVYDTIFNFDESGKVCLACFKVKKAPANKIIKTAGYTFQCNYLSKANKRLQIKTEDNDTCTVFELTKKTLEQYNDNGQAFTVMVNGKKYLVDKNFTQLTFKPYFDVRPSLDPQFYLVEIKEDNEVVYAGLIDRHEKEIIPHQFSMVKINPVDSLIYGCRAGLVENYYDDIFDFTGNKIESYHKHIELPTKHFVVLKLFEPRENFVIYNTKTKQELPLKADEVHFYEQDQLLIRLKSDWYVYDLQTNTKKEKNY